VSETITAPPLLVPRPSTVERRGGIVRIQRGLEQEVDELLARRRLRATNFEPRRGLGLFTGMPAEHPEAYLLTIEPAERDGIPISISAAGDLGVRNGLRTLKQLLRQYGSRLPCLSIHDQPAFATRGLMLDISRDKVPTLDQLKSVVDLLASLKFNHLQLYTEHTFAYKGHEEVWADASPLTPEEVRELDQYASGRGVELAANQNCFGHLAVWLKRERYNPLAEIEGDNLWKFMQWDRRGPFSLCPILPESEAFVRDLLGQLLPCFQSSLVNIGCDETFDVGWGRSKDEVHRRAAEFAGDEAKARAAVFFDFVNKICDIVRSHNKRPMMWADIALHHPDMLARLGKDVIGIGWGYEPDAKFAEECAHLRAHGLTAWVAPGTSTWRSITGRTTESRANMLAAAACAEKGAARGFLVCDWGDVGHMQHWPLTMMRLADAAEAAWSGPTARFDADHTRAASLHAFDDPSQSLAHWLNQLGDLDLALRTRCNVRNASAIFNDLFPPIPPKPGHRYLIDAPIEEWESLVTRLDELAASRPPARDSRINKELDHTLAFARLAIDHGLSCRRSSDGLAPRPEDRPALHTRAQQVLDELRRLWPTRNRPGGLEQSCSHVRRLLEALR
jgi:hexosaminidase